MNFMTREVTGMAEIDGEQYAARKLGCEISADPLNPLDPIKKVCKSHHPMRICPFLTVPTGVLSSSTPPAPQVWRAVHHPPLAVSQILADLAWAIVVAAGLLHDTVEAPTIRWINAARIRRHRGRSGRWRYQAESA